MLSHQINQNSSKDKKISPNTIKPSTSYDFTAIVEKIKNNESFSEGINELYYLMTKDPSMFIIFFIN